MRKSQRILLLDRHNVPRQDIPSCQCVHQYHNLVLKEYRRTEIYLQFSLQRLVHSRQFADISREIHQDEQYNHTYNVDKLPLSILHSVQLGLCCQIHIHYLYQWLDCVALKLYNLMSFDIHEWYPIGLDSTLLPYPDEYRFEMRIFPVENE